MADPFRPRTRLDGGRSWRSIAVGLCNTLNTPLSEVLRFGMEEALLWYAECAKFTNPKANG